MNEEYHLSLSDEEIEALYKDKYEKDLLILYENDDWVIYSMLIIYYGI